MKTFGHKSNNNSMINEDQFEHENDFYRNEIQSLFQQIYDNLIDTLMDQVNLYLEIQINDVKVMKNVQQVKVEI